MSQRPPSKKNENSAITSYGVVRRNLGDEPSIGKVARTGRAVMPKKRHRHAKSEDGVSKSGGKNSNQILIRWGIVTFIVATSVILLMTMNMTKTQSEEGAGTQRKIKTEFVGKEGESKTAEDPKLAPPPPEELERRAKAFFNISNEQELLSQIRASQIPQDQIFSMFQASCQENGEVKKVEYRGPVDSRLFRAEALQVKYTNQRNQMLAFALGADGTWKVDLDAFFRYNTIPLDTLMDGGDHDGVFRLYAARGNYYNGAFADESKWLALSLGSPGRDSLIIGYVDRKSPVCEAVMLAMNKTVNFVPVKNSRPAKPVQLTLRLAHRKGNEARQVEILDLISDGWVIPEKPANPVPAKE
jgi:hypothetical protein